MQESGGAKSMTGDQPTGPARVTEPTPPQQAGKAQDPWWWVQPSVWTERMLTRLEQSEPATVWFRLWDKVIAADNLQAAYWAVWRNGGAPGVDGQTDGPTDGLRRMGCLVWNTAHVPMVSLVEKPLTGEPDAGNPPVRFGGRGGANPAIPTPMNNVGITPRLRNLFLHEPQGHWPHPCPSPQDLRARCGLNDQ